MDRLKRIFSQGWLSNLVSVLTRGYYPITAAVPILTGAGTVHGPRSTHISYGPASLATAHGPKNTGEVNS